MARKINYGKISAVLFLTILLWVWTDLALDDSVTIPHAVISVAKSTDPGFWVTFEGDRASVPIEEIKLKGPAKKTDDVKRKLNDGSLDRHFFLDPQAQGWTSPGQHTLILLDFLKKSDQLRQLGLTVDTCKPDKISVNVVELETKLLVVKCVDEEEKTITATSDPLSVEVPVPSAWSGERLTAYVRLTRAEQQQARQSPIEKTPYIILTPGQTKEVPTVVKITTPPREDRRVPYTITAARLGITFSLTLQGKYEVQIGNRDELISNIKIYATPEARKAYANSRYQVMLEIDDKDINSEDLRRPLVYNFPPEFLEKGEIKLNQQPDIARFKLVSLAPSAP